MRNKTNRGTKFPGFFECVNHDRLKIFFEEKPPTMCHTCFKRINGNLALYLAEQMSNAVIIENLVVQCSDTIEQLLKRVARLEEKE